MLKVNKWNHIRISDTDLRFIFQRCKSLKPSPLEIYKLLPKTNCKKCGLPNCMAFAVRLLSGQAKIEDCPDLVEREEFRENYEKLKELLGERPAAEVSLPRIDNEEACNGCGICVVVCPANARADPEVGSGKGASRKEGLIFVVVNGKVKIMDISKCRRQEDLTTCRVCEEFCPNNVIKIG